MCKTFLCSFILFLVFSPADIQAQSSPPNVSHTNPSVGTVGTVVTVFGQNFGATHGTRTVSFNGTVAAGKKPNVSSCAVDESRVKFVKTKASPLHVLRAPPRTTLKNSIPV
jgi:hypothetical protein